MNEPTKKVLETSVWLNKLEFKIIQNTQQFFQAKIKIAAAFNY